MLLQWLFLLVFKDTSMIRQSSLKQNLTHHQIWSQSLKKYLMDMIQKWLILVDYSQKLSSKDKHNHHWRPKFILRLTPIFKKWFSLENLFSNNVTNQMIFCSKSWGLLFNKMSIQLLFPLKLKTLMNLTLYQPLQTRPTSQYE